MSIAVDRGQPVVVRILEPDDERARALDDEAARLCERPVVNGERARVEALHAFADVYRAAAALQCRYPGQLEL